MNRIKSLALVGVAATALFAAQAFAVPTCPAAPVGGATTKGSPVCIAETSPDPDHNGAPADLQSQLNQMTTSGPGINVYNGQKQPNAIWSVASSGGSFNNLVFEIAGNASSNSFGIFDPSKPFDLNSTNSSLQLFSGPESAGSKTTLVNNGGGSFTAYYLGQTPASESAQFSLDNEFGYYLSTKDGTFFSIPGMNQDPGSDAYYPNGMPHMVAFQGDNQTMLLLPGQTKSAKFDSGEYFLAWEDQPFLNSDLDYNDFVVLVESVYPVPEPAALGMFGLGVLLIGLFAGLRRRSYNA